MTDQTATKKRRRTLRVGVVRRTGDRMVAGLAAGIGARLGISAIYVRATFVVFAFAGGVGLLLYLVGWALTPDDAEVTPPAEEQPASANQVLGLILAVLGSLIGLRALGLWFGDAPVWPIAFIVYGVAVVWDRGRTDYSRRFAALTRPSEESGSGRTRWQVVIGSVLMAAGLIAFFAALDAVASLGGVVLAVVITAAGFMLVFGPSVWRLADEVAKERRNRIRSEERAEMAAHLHDSVLQTLALIQRTDDPRRMVTLARAQERELRAWLYGSAAEGAADSVEAAMQEAASRVEEALDVPVEVVVVGERAIDDRSSALLLATIEAMTNAATHSGADRVSVYVECSEEQTEAWISDQGKGFEPTEVPSDRHGIAESITARMQRHGGTATISSNAGEGTEVHLVMPVGVP